MDARIADARAKLGDTTILLAITISAMK